MRIMLAEMEDYINRNHNYVSSVSAVCNSMHDMWG